MAKTKNRDRRAVVEQMRREQQRAERRRTIIVISVCAVVAVVIIGLAAVPLIKQNQLVGGSLAELGSSPSAAGCQDVVKKKATGNQEHKPVGTDIKYADAPPAFGPHWPTPAAFSRKFYTAGDRPQLQEVVHNLEHGYTLLWYDDTAAKSKKQVAVIKAISKKFEGQKLSDKFIALPWTSKDEDGKSFPKGTHIALTHWSTGGDPSDVKKQQGVWQYCGKVSGQAVKSFMKQYPYTDSPEPQGA
jgi:hypothetical protein